MSDVIDLGSAGAAQAICGPVHRHISLIQEAFRDPAAPRAAPVYAVTLHGQGTLITLCGRPGAEAAMAQARRILEGLLDHYRNRRKVHEAEVQAAIAFSAGAAGRFEARGEGPLQLPQLGGLTLRTPRQAYYVAALRDRRLDMIFGIGPAGTGKTFLAVAVAVEALRNGEVDRIVVARPAVEAGEKLGFLPGTQEDKIDPYMAPIWDAFRNLLGENELKGRREKKVIEVAPLAYMRGRTLAQAFVIVDEAQNATRQQMRMVLTRMGDGSRMVVTGDPSQVDLPRMQDSGLAHAAAIMDGVEGVEIVRFAAADVVRHPMVARVIAAYEADDRARAARDARAGPAWDDPQRDDPHGDRDDATGGV